MASERQRPEHRVIAKSAEDILALIRLEREYPDFRELTTPLLGQTPSLPEPAQSPAVGHLAKESSSTLQHDEERQLLKLRHRLAGEAPFTEAITICGDLLSSRNPATLAFALETIILKGSPTDIANGLRQLGSRLRTAMPIVQGRVRGAALAKLHKRSGWELMADAVLDHVSDAQRLPVERLFCFAFLCDRQSPSALHYFHKHEVEFLQVVDSMQGKTAIDTNWLWFHAAVSAHLSNDAEHVLKYASRVDTDATQYAAAIDLARQSGSYGGKSSENSLSSRLRQKTSASEQINLIRAAFESAIVSGNELDKIVLADWLKDPFDDLLPIGTLWRDFSLCLTDFFEHVDAIANLMQPFRVATRKAIDHRLCASFWSEFANSCWRQPRFGGIHAAALFQRFLLEPKVHDVGLWWAYQFFHDSAAHSADLSGLTWADLLQMASNVLSGDLLDPASQQHITKALAISRPLTEVATIDAREYLGTAGQPPQWVPRSIARHFAEFHQADLRQLCCDVLAKTGPLCNSDLGLLVQASREIGKHDLAWRGLAILVARKSLPKQLKPAWHLSRESTDPSSMLPIAQPDLNLALAPMTSNLEPFFKKLLVLGPYLPRLLHQGQSDIKLSSNPEAAFGADLWQLVPAQTRSWIESAGHHYRIRQLGRWCSASDLMPTRTRPAANSLYLKAFQLLGHHLGCNAFGWDIRQLVPLFKQTSPHTAQSMPAHARAALHGLPSHLPRSEIDLANDALIGLVAKLAVMVSGQHYQALKDLQEINASLTNVRATEGFIICAEYSERRHQKRLESSLDMPTTVASILAERLCGDDRTKKWPPSVQWNLAR